MERKVRRIRAIQHFVLGMMCTSLAITLLFIFGGFYWARAHPSNQARFNAAIDRLNNSSQRFHDMLDMVDDCLHNTHTPTAYDRCVILGYNRIDSRVRV